MNQPGDDLDRIMAVMQAAFDPAYGEAWNRRQVEDALVIGNCHYGLYCEDGKAAGFFLSRTGFEEEELLLLAVSPEFRNKGIGQKLLSRFAQQARERGVQRLFLEMRRGNPAENLYRNNGFLPVGERPNYYWTPSGMRLDAISFACDIC